MKNDVCASISYAAYENAQRRSRKRRVQAIADKYRHQMAFTHSAARKGLLISLATRARHFINQFHARQWFSSSHAHVASSPSANHRRRNAARSRQSRYQAIDADALRPMWRIDSRRRRTVGPQLSGHLRSPKKHLAVASLRLHFTHASRPLCRRDFVNFPVPSRSTPGNIAAVLSKRHAHWACVSSADIFCLPSRTSRKTLTSLAPKFKAGTWHRPSAQSV